MDDTRDKVIALEVRVEEFGKKLDAQAETVGALTEALKDLTDLLQQAKGAKWGVGLLLVAFGAASTWAPTLIKWAMAIR